MSQKKSATRGIWLFLKKIYQFLLGQKSTRKFQGCRIAWEGQKKKKKKNLKTAMANIFCVIAKK